MIPSYNVCKKFVFFVFDGTFFDVGIVKRKACKFLDIATNKVESKAKMISLQPSAIFCSIDKNTPGLPLGTWLGDKLTLGLTLVL